MNVGAVGAVGQGGAVYALSPYLSGTVRTSDAAVAAERTAASAAAATAATTAAAAARTGPADVIAATAAPYLNPAIPDIAARAAITVPAAGTAIVATPAATALAQSNSPAGALQGDSGLLIQSYGAVALVAAPLALAPIFTQPAPLAIPPVAAIPATQRTSLRPNQNSVT
jgi:hypothetical protein